MFVVIISWLIANPASTSDDVISTRSVAAVHLVSVCVGTLVIIIISRFVADYAFASTSNDGI